MDDRPGVIPASAHSTQAKDAASTGPAVQAIPLLDFERLFDALPGAHLVIAADPDHVVFAVSDGYLCAAMTRREAILGQRLFDVFSEHAAVGSADDVNNLRTSLARVVDTGRPDRIALQRYDVRRPNGVFEERWWQPVNTPLYSVKGAMAYILHSVEDVTAAVRERRDAAGLLRAERDRSHGILDSMAEGFVLLDPTFSVTEINAEGLRIDGRPREAILGRHLLEAWPEAEHFPVWPAYRRAMAERAPVALEYRYVSDRRDVWLEVRAYPVAEGAGLAVFYRDVTARRRAEAALRNSEGRLRALVSASSDALYCMSADWTGMRQLSGGGFLSDTGSLNRAWLEEYIHPDDQARVLTAIQQAVRTKGVFELEHRVRRVDGTLGWTLSRAVPLLDPDGGIREWFAAASDVTARKEAEAALRHANEALEARVAERTAELTQAGDALRQSQKMEAVGQLTGGIAHDFNNMLQAISGSLDMLQRRMAQGRTADADRYAEGARKTVEHAAALTQRLLAFARRQTLQPKPVEPDELVLGMAELIRRTVGPAITVELHLNDGIWSVLCDPGQLENALLNLAINARDAMPNGGQLTIRTADLRLVGTDVAGQDGVGPGEYVEVSVADTGTGMDDATRERAFEPFFTTKPIGQGTGLGLSQVYGFVRQSGGAVRLDSAPGRGTVVRLYLPRHEVVGGTGQVGSASAVATPQADVGEVLLLIEDEVDVRTAAAEHLRDMGYRVLEAGDGPAALRLLHDAARVDLIVSDVGLPGGLNGRQVAEAARERKPGLPVLFITGYAGIVLDGQLDPNMTVLGKPFALETLAVRTRAMLDAVLAT